MSDLISRQAVLKLLSTMPPEEAMTKALLIQSVKQMDLPSEQPETEKRISESAQNVPNDDSISRKAAIEAINSHFGFNIEEEYGSAVQEVINGLPSAHPETEKRTPQTEQNVSDSDLISRKAALDAIERHECFTRGMYDAISILPSAQPEPAIPLEWIAKHLEWLDNCDNDFAQLAKVGIRAMVEIWKTEKTQ